MMEIIENSKCTGCTACINNCPKNAISFDEGSDGFKYPVIDQNKCIDCGLCKKICPVLNTKSNKSINKCYVAYNKDSNERLNASSGSIFSTIANYILDNKGIVIGAAFDKNNHLKHIAVEKKKDLEPLRKSKYLQSDLGNIFKYIKEQIKTKKVLFVGTPCQVAGLKSFIKNNNNLITIDLFCHGVPSAKLFDKYIKELEQNNNDKLINYDFRDNSTGWDSYSNTATFKNKKVSELQIDNKYMRLFLSDIALRESCYNCNFKLGNKYSDITLGDFWGVKNVHPEMYNKEGVSAVIINTDIGNNIFRDIIDLIRYKECTIDDILETNQSLVKSSIRSNSRNDFFTDIQLLSVDKLVKKYAKKTTINKRIIRRIKKILNR